MNDKSFNYEPVGVGWIGIGGCVGGAWAGRSGWSGSGWRWVIQAAAGRVLGFQSFRIRSTSLDGWWGASDRRVSVLGRNHWTGPAEGGSEQLQHRRSLRRRRRRQWRRPRVWFGQPWTVTNSFSAFLSRFFPPILQRITSFVRTSKEWIHFYRISMRQTWPAPPTYWIASASRTYWNRRGRSQRRRGQRRKKRKRRRRMDSSCGGWPSAQMSGYCWWALKLSAAAAAAAEMLLNVLLNCCCCLLLAKLVKIAGHLCTNHFIWMNQYWTANDVEHFF